MIATVQGDLVLLAPNSPSFKLIWKGAQVPGLIRVRIDADEDEHRVKIWVHGTSPVHAELAAAGVIVRQES
jgi:hypothetical protein